jgi:hypothetical protein
MATIPLRDRVGALVTVALVDDEAFARIDRHRWSLMGDVARRTVRIGGRAHTVLMHREVVGATVGDGTSVEHANGNRLDNRRDNLRVKPSSPAATPPSRTRALAAVAPDWSPDIQETA